MFKMILELNKLQIFSFTCTVSKKHNLSHKEMCNKNSQSRDINYL